MRLVTQYQSQLHGYLYALMHNMADAEDVLQDTIVVLWRKFDQFESGTNFLHWALKTARFEALKFQRTMRRNRRFFSEELAVELEDGSFRKCDDKLIGDREAALANCIDRLGERDRQLLLQCYAPGVTIQSVAEKAGRSAQSICNSLRRIRQCLFDCVNGAMSQEEAVS